jgi:hypothetical protein
MVKPASGGEPEYGGGGLSDGARPARGQSVREALVAVGLGFVRAQ